MGNVRRDSIWVSAGNGMAVSVHHLELHAMVSREALGISTNARAYA